MITTINEFKALNYIKNIFKKEQYILRKKSDDTYTYLQYSTNYGRTFNHIAGYPYDKADKEFDKLIDKYKLNTIDGLKTYASNKLETDKNYKKINKEKIAGLKIPLK